MTKAAGNDAPEVVATINEAIRLVEADQKPAAIELLANLTGAFPFASSAKSYLAWYLLSAGQFEQAVDQARQAATLSPGSERVSLVLFHVLWRSGQHVEALEEMKRFLQVKPTSSYSQMIPEWEL